jgi:hypothetical protein
MCTVPRFTGLKFLYISSNHYTTDNRMLMELGYFAPNISEVKINLSVAPWPFHCPLLVEVLTDISPLRPRHLVMPSSCKLSLYITLQVFQKFLPLLQNCCNQLDFNVSSYAKALNAPGDPSLLDYRDIFLHLHTLLTSRPGVQHLYLNYSYCRHIVYPSSDLSKELRPLFPSCSSMLEVLSAFSATIRNDYTLSRFRLSPSPDFFRHKKATFSGHKIPRLALDLDSHTSTPPSGSSSPASSPLSGALPLSLDRKRKLPFSDPPPTAKSLTDTLEDSFALMLHSIHLRCCLNGLGLKPHNTVIEQRRILSRLCSPRYPHHDAIDKIYTLIRFHQFYPWSLRFLDDPSEHDD